jgi:hypothetical protein
MNERIREFEKQSFITTETQEISGAWDNIVEPFRYVTVTETNFSLEKFAELIVRECMNQVREQYLPVLEDEIMMKDTYWDGYVLCGVDSYVAIKEHFGVEE